MAIMYDKDRAADAWKRVREIASKDEELQKRYRSQVRSGPAMIQRSGLGQFLAFLASKGFENGDQEVKGKEGANAQLYRHLTCWVAKALGHDPDNRLRPENIAPGRSQNGQFDLLAFLLNSSTTLEQTMHATTEALAWMRWARRFADSQLTMPEANDD